MKKNLKVNKYHVTQDFCYSLYVVFYRILPHCRCFHEKHETPVFLLTVHYCAMIDKKKLYRFWKLHQSFFFIFFCLGHKCVRPQFNILTLKSFYSHITFLRHWQMMKQRQTYFDVKMEYNFVVYMYATNFCNLYMSPCSSCLFQ